jgi:hypothetical protein
LRHAHPCRQSRGGLDARTPRAARSGGVARAPYTDVWQRSSVSRGPRACISRNCKTKKIKFLPFETPWSVARRDGVLVIVLLADTRSGGCTVRDAPDPGWAVEVAKVAREAE